MITLATLIVNTIATPVTLLIVIAVTPVTLCVGTLITLGVVFKDGVNAHFIFKAIKIATDIKLVKLPCMYC